MSIRLSKSFELPDVLASGKMGIVGRTGSGKTNTAVVMAEQLIPQGIPVAILDPQGDWWGLRSQFPIAILGGEHGDVPLEPTGGALAADFLVNERVSVLFDLYLMGEGEMVRFAHDFGKRLWATNKDLLHIFLDEADLFAPQSNLNVERAKCLSVWQNVVRRGRKRGLGVTMLTQRPAVINKDLFTQAEPLFVHRMTSSQDLRAIDDYLEFHGIDRPERRRITSEIASLPKGECFAISPGELGIGPTRIKVNHRKSFDSSRTPEAGKSRREPKALASVDLDALKSSMASTIEQAKANDPKALKAEVARLTAELAKKPASAPAAAVKVDQGVIDRAVKKAVDESDKWWSRECMKVLRTLHKVKDALGIESLPESPPVRPNSEPVAAASAPVPAARPPAPVMAARRTEAIAPTGDLGAAHMRVLRSLFWLKDEERTPAKVAFFADYTVNGHFNNLMGNLRSRGLVQGWALTDAGLATIPPEVEPKPTGAELREWMRSKLNSAENKILDVLMAAGGERVPAETLAERAGFTVNGHFNNCLGHMRTIQVAEGFAKDGGVKAAEVFFG